MSQRDNRGTRRRRAGRLFVTRRRFLWPLGFMAFLSVVALAMVWQHVQFTDTWLKHEEARARNESLLSDLDAHRYDILNQAALADLDERARRQLKLDDPEVSNMMLVEFDPSLQAAPRVPGLIDRIVPAAVAREGRPNGAGSQDRP